MTHLLERKQQAPAPSRRAAESAIFVMVAAICIALGAWGSSTADLSAVGGVGLVAVLPGTYWAAIIGLNVAFAVAIRRHAHGWALAALTVALIIVIVGAAAMAVDIPRGEVTFRHAGIVDALSSGMRPDGSIDAYFDWPGYFSWLSTVAKAAGLNGVIGLGLWAPVLTVVVWAALVRNIFVALGATRNWAWVGVWLFVLGNWIDQDYLSPQGFGFGVYLAVILLAVGPLAAWTSVPLLPYLRESGVVGLIDWWRERQPLEPDSRRRTGALVLSVVLIAGLIPSHQLTPFAVVLALLAIAALGRSWAPWLALLVIAMASIWFLTGAENFLDGHPLIQNSAGLQNAASANLVDRLEGSQGHEVVARVRILFTGAMWMLAVVGASMSGRRKLKITVPVALAFAPFLLVPMQTYGGEMLLRAALFSLPFVALLMAAIFVPPPPQQRMGLITVALLAVVGTVLSVASVTARYGNSAFDMFTQSEMDGVSAAYRLAPDRALLVSAAHPTPWQDTEYIEHPATTLQDLCKPVTTADECFQLLRGRAWEAGEPGLVLIVTRSSEKAIQLQGLLPQGMLDGVLERVMADPAGTRAFVNHDSAVYLLNPVAEENAS
ncbi:MAG TPA: glycosyltransferase [Actinomycetes bacterium]|nr:glycosyltransferase [Actinomycetes bacterium]